MGSHARSHLVAFEGLDADAQAGGVGSRLTGLARVLTEAGLESYLWFRGDLELAGPDWQWGHCLPGWGHGLRHHHPAGWWMGPQPSPAP